MAGELRQQLRAPLAALADRLAEAAGDHLSALLVYGSAITGEFRPDRSDVNLMLVLEEASPAVLDALAPVLVAARRELAVEPFLLTRSELPRVTDVFPLKLRHIARNHVLLRGADALAGLEIHPEHLRLRVEQELRNHELRLRRQYIFAAEDAGSLQWTLAQTGGSLLVQLEALLALVGQELPPNSPYESVRNAISKSFDLDTEALDQLHRLRRGETCADLGSLYHRVLALLRRAAAIADRTEAG